MAIIQVEEAISMLTSAVQPITEIERVGLLEASGRVLAEDITGIQDQPPFPRSPLDGYAVKGAETLEASKEKPVILKVVGKVCAGEVFSGTVGPGECIRIMTGAAIPDGADTVIRQEDTSYADTETVIQQGGSGSADTETVIRQGGSDSGDPETVILQRGSDSGDPETVILQEDTDHADGETAFHREGCESADTDRVIDERKHSFADAEYVSIYKGSDPYRNYCYAGEDYKKGDILIDRGRVIEGRHIAIIAGTGREEVEVFRKPEIAVISTGDEVIAPGQPWRAGKIYDANRYYVCGRLKDMRMDQFTSSHCPDEVEEMCMKLMEAAEKCDLIITTGGVSVGEKDIMHQVFTELAGGLSNQPNVHEDILTDQSVQQTGQTEWTARKLFYRVRLKPGSPTLAFTLTKKAGAGSGNGEAREVLVICLTGNPYGVVVNYELLVRPVLAVLTGNEQMKLKKIRCILGNDSPKRGGRRFLRAYMKELAASEYAASEHPADGHPADGHPADRHPADEHPADRHLADEHPASESSEEGGRLQEDREEKTRREETVCIVPRVRIIAGSQQSGTISSLDKSNCLVEIGPDSTGKAGEHVWVYL